MTIFKSIIPVIIIFIFTSNLKSQSFDGYALYNHLGGNITYLIDKNGDVAHNWIFKQAM